MLTFLSADKLLLDARDFIFVVIKRLYTYRHEEVNINF